ncbi:MAG: hypothetical protein ABSF23_04660 [Terracidiphilus sp.]|jgi:hypothetical protein
MNSSPLHVPDSPPASARAASQPHHLADRAYQVLTVAAMLLLIWSLWLFR